MIAGFKSLAILFLNWTNESGQQPAYLLLLEIFIRLEELGLPEFPILLQEISILSISPSPPEISIEPHFTLFY